MPYLIDGHNLIPHVPGLSLEAADDEDRLIRLLQGFCRRKRKRAEVYFDNAPPGQPVERKFGRVTACFVRQGRTADQAIQARLARLGPDAPNWTVVSSDREVLAAARAARAGFLTSGEFARQLSDSLSEEPGPDVDHALAPDELAEWLRLFGERGEADEGGFSEL